MLSSCVPYRGFLPLYPDPLLPTRECSTPNKSTSGVKLKIRTNSLARKALTPNSWAQGVPTMVNIKKKESRKIEGAHVRSPAFLPPKPSSRQIVATREGDLGFRGSDFLGVGA